MVNGHKHLNTSCDGVRGAPTVDSRRRDAVTVARRSEMIVSVDHPTDRAAWLPESRSRYDEFEADGDAKGINFSLAVAVELTRRKHATARDANERGFALNLLGTALSRLGERESGKARVEEAAAAYRAALTERTRERVPLDWARTQVCVGDALESLGEREGGTARLEEAVAALTEWTRRRVPLDCAEVQHNLGDALESLGEREGGTARLEEAGAVYRAALTERPRKRVPLDWAATQHNLGNALQRLGERESGTAWLRARTSRRPASRSS
jgi:tetratricopeptide (TPR) repeat protein